MIKVRMLIHTYIRDATKTPPNATKNVFLWFSVIMLVVPAYKRASWDRTKAALNDMHQEILEKVRTDSSIDTIWTLFRDKLCEAINEHIPTRTIKESMRLPWVTTRLRRLGRRRDRASKRARRNGHDPRLRALARQLKHDHQRAMRKAYWDLSTTWSPSITKTTYPQTKEYPSRNVSSNTPIAYGRNAQEYHPWSKETDWSPTR